MDGTGWGMALGLGVFCRKGKERKGKESEGKGKGGSREKIDILTS